MLLSRGIIQLFFTAMIDFYDHICPTKPIQTQEENRPKNLGPQNSTDWMYISAIGIIGFTTAYTNYCGLGLLPLGDATTIFATFPVLVFYPFLI